MASTKPVPPKAAAAAPKSAKQGASTAPPRGPAAHVSALTDAATTRLAAAKGLPGWRGLRTVIGTALAAGDTAVLVESRDKTVSLRRRGAAGWHPTAPLLGDDTGAVFAALAALGTADATDASGLVVQARGFPRRALRVETRKVAAREQVLVLLGAELPRPERPRIGRLVAAALARLVPPVLRRTPPPPARDPSLPVVALQATGPDAESRTAAAAESDGYVAACDLVAAAVRDRATTIVIEGGPQGVSVQFDVDGVGVPAPAPEGADVAAMVAVLRTVAGIDPKARGPRTARITALVEAKSWPCTITARRGAAAERLEVAIDQMRPKFKTLADVGVSENVVAGLQEYLKLESGLILLAGPRRGGVSTLFDNVINAADRLLRDFVLLEDAASPRPELPNVKPFRWDAAGGEKPVAALEAALREYPHVVATCDLEDADLARRLVAQAGEGRLVIVGIRAADAVDGIARLVSLGVDRQALARVLLGAVGVRLVRKLCPQCRIEYLPPVQDLAPLKLDPDATITLFRPPASGCSVCTGTGYLGRTAVGELVPGTAVRTALAATAEAKTIREAAAKAGVVTLARDAVAKAARGVTALDEVQRLFRKA